MSQKSTLPLNLGKIRKRDIGAMEQTSVDDKNGIID